MTYITRIFLPNILSSNHVIIFGEHIMCQASFILGVSDGAHSYRYAAYKECTGLNQEEGNFRTLWLTSWTKVSENIFITQKRVP